MLNANAKEKMRELLGLLPMPWLMFLSTLCLSVLSSDVYFEDALDDGAYMRREHCLTKPYHGKQALCERVVAVVEI